MAKKRDKFPEPPQEMCRVLLDETDRGCVLAAHGYLDKALEDILRAYFLNAETANLLDWFFTGQQPPWQSFYMKLSIVRLLCLLDAQSHSAMEKLNDLRVHFAHYAGRVSLTDARASSIYDALNHNCKQEIQERENSKWLNRGNQSDARMKFIHSAVSLHGAVQLPRAFLLRRGELAGIMLSDDPTRKQRGVSS